EAWSGLYLHSGSNLSAAGYTSLRFWIHGGSGGGQQLQVQLADSALNFSAAVAVTSPSAGAWTEVVVPLSAFGGVSQISGVVWQEVSGGPQATFYLDDIRFIGGPTPTPATLALNVDVNANRHSISPYIYGMNFADVALASELGLPVRRWGGNATTRYNWQN